MICCPVLCRFQSTLPRGERPNKETGEILAYNFNPRSREGSDDAPAQNEANYMNFNPRSREGSDDIVRIAKEHAKDFNPRSREGSDIFP